MIKKRLSKTVWYGSEVDTEGNPVVPGLAEGADDLEGLHHGELYLHEADDNLSLWARTLTNQVKPIGGLGGGGSLWKLMETESGEKYLFTDFNVVTQKGITSYTDGTLLDLPGIYNGLPIDNQTLYWEEIKEEVGTDEEGEPIYKTTKVLKAKGSTGGGGGSVDLSELDKRYLAIGGTAEAAKKLATARKIWGQSFDGTGNITGELNLGLSGRIRKPSAYETYDNIRIEMLERINNIPPRLAIQASDYNGVSPQGFISIGGIAEDGAENKLQHLFLFALTTSVFGKLKVVADNASIGTSAKGVTFQVNESGVLIVDAKNGFEIDSLIYDKSNNQLKFGGDLLLNEGLITYDKKKGYFTLNGDLLVTGGVISYASTGRVQSWMITAESYDKITSSSDTDVYTAKTTSMIKEKVDEVAAASEDAVKKLAAIKSALNGITASSSLSAIASALVTIKNSL